MLNYTELLAMEDYGDTVCRQNHANHVTVNALKPDKQQNMASTIGAGPTQCMPCTLDMI